MIAGGGGGASSTATTSAVTAAAAAASTAVAATAIAASAAATIPAATPAAVPVGGWCWVTIAASAGSAIAGSGASNAAATIAATSTAAVGGWGWAAIGASAASPAAATIAASATTADPISGGGWAANAAGPCTSAVGAAATVAKRRAEPTSTAGWWGIAVEVVPTVASRLGVVSRGLPAATARLAPWGDMRPAARRRSKRTSTGCLALLVVRGWASSVRRRRIWSLVGYHTLIHRETSSDCVAHAELAAVTSGCCCRSRASLVPPALSLALGMDATGRHSHRSSLVQRTTLLLSCAVARAHDSRRCRRRRGRRPTPRRLQRRCLSLRPASRRLHRRCLSLTGVRLQRRARPTASACATCRLSKERRWHRRSMERHWRRHTEANFCLGCGGDRRRSLVQLARERERWCRGMGRHRSGGKARSATAS